MKACNRWTISNRGWTRCATSQKKSWILPGRASPPGWIAGEEAELEQLLERLYQRRKRIPELLGACRELRTNPFPNWR